MISIQKYFLVLALSLFAILSCQAQVEQKSFDVLLRTMLKETVPTVSVAELSKEGLGKKVLLDAREEKEFKVSHLKNARWVGYDDFKMSRLNGISKNDEIIIYCSIGVRSEKIGEKLKAQGYTNVKNLYGSIFEWVNQGNSVYDMNNQPTKRVHAYSKTWGVWLRKGVKVY